jgi:hypothetical protein
LIETEEELAASAGSQSTWSINAMCDAYQIDVNQGLRDDPLIEPSAELSAKYMLMMRA